MTARIIAIAVIAALMAGCNKPRTIPDDKLEAMIHDIFISNAYYDIGMTSLLADSIDMYSPIFDRYGYTAADMLHTMEGLSKRKSMGLADFVERASVTLQKERMTISAQRILSDTIDSRLSRRYARVVYSNDTLRTFTATGSQKKPDISIPVTPGRYQVEFSYMLDSTSAASYIYRQWLSDGNDVPSFVNTRSYRKGGWNRETIEAEVDNDRILRLEALFAYSYSARVAAGRDPRFKLLVDSVKITHYIPKEAVRDSFIQDISRMPLADSIKNWLNDARPDTKIIVPLRPDTSGTASRSSSDVR